MGRKLQRKDHFTALGALKAMTQRCSLFASASFSAFSPMWRKRFLPRSGPSFLKTSSKSRTRALLSARGAIAPGVTEENWKTLEQQKQIQEIWWKLMPHDESSRNFNETKKKLDSMYKCIAQHDVVRSKYSRESVIQGLLQVPKAILMLSYTFVQHHLNYAVQNSEQTCGTKLNTCGSDSSPQP